VNPAHFRVGYFVGSLSSQSINRRLARALVRLAPESMQLTEISYGDLPLYNRDYDADYPAAARAFKDAVADAEAVLFVSPEYNRSIPGALKNAIDWGSRPYGQNAFARKPAAIIGASTGKIGTAVAQQQLRSVLSFLTMPQMTSPEAYIQMTPGLVDEDGNVTIPETETFLRSFIEAFGVYIERVYTALPRM
jgi:chromate reductase